MLVTMDIQTNVSMTVYLLLMNLHIFDSSLFRTVGILLEKINKILIIGIIKSQTPQKTFV